MSVLAGNKAGIAVVCVAQFVVVLDVTIVATALPVIGDDLGFAPADLSWVITAYTVVLAGLLILGGRVADLAGARRMFRVGLVAFALGSLACAVAWTPVVLIGTRALQGVGAALLSPAALAALGELTRGGDSRNAVGWWTASAAGGGASGWVLGGVITELVGWRAVFAVNVPIAVLALAVTGWALRRSTPRNVPLDVRGAVTITAGIGLATYALTRIAESVADPVGWVAFGLAAATLALFVRGERRSRDPMLPGSLFGTPGVVGGNLTAVALTASTTPAMFTAILWVQDVMRLPPARSSLLFPAFNLAVIAASLVAPRGVRRLGVRWPLAFGFGLIAAGACLLVGLPRSGPLLMGAFATMGVGLGVASVASTTSGVASVAPSLRGVASGLLNSSAQLGNALGLALAAPLVATAGHRLGYVTAALVAVAGIVAATLTLRRRTRWTAADTSARTDRPPPSAARADPVRRACPRA
jgi:MFS family permease